MTVEHEVETLFVVLRRPGEIDRARGVADLYVHASRGTKLWDVCAPHAVLQAAGGRVSDVRGQPLRYDPRHLGNDAGMLATQGSRHAEIVAALAPVVATWTWL